MGKLFNLIPFAITITGLPVRSELWRNLGAFLAAPSATNMTIVLSEFPDARLLAPLLSKRGRI
jgi:hypothetical protein